MAVTTRDPWTWRAVFANGELLDEVDSDAPEGRGWAVAERCALLQGTRITQAILIPEREGLRTHVVRAVGEASARVFRRRTLILSPTTGEEAAPRPDPVTAIALSWPDGHTLYSFFYTDGSVVVSDDLNAV